MFSEKCQYTPEGCVQAHNGEQECALNADDRAVVDAIKKSVETISGTVEHTKAITRSLSVSLIGKSNGDTMDDGGGRIGRLEKLVIWAISGVVGILIWLLAQLFQRLVLK